MSADIIPIADDPKQVQRIAESHGLMVQAGKHYRLVQEYRHDADIVSISAFMAGHRHLLTDHNGPEAV